MGERGVVGGPVRAEGDVVHEGHGAVVVGGAVVADGVPAHGDEREVDAGPEGAHPVPALLLAEGC